ncbi:hypothetical protein OSB04_un000074 [Centaurea solstitialis]|uniref:Reverse transcriptase Ty1/copia-type domain-containing protein n=1 Tax=Centaurea solstitialis TaxID=347529 RepID=A0AA38SIG4_9ASTR|nr:hypothetical protein OSB04_un000074 [Centaurea solstitialis]
MRLAIASHGQKRLTIVKVPHPKIKGRHLLDARKDSVQDIGCYNDAIRIASLKQSLSSSFEMKDLGKLHYFLGLEVLSDSSGTYLCQAKYISDLLSKAAVSDNKVASTPLEHNLHLAPNSGPPLQDPTRYRQLVGSLVYLTVTRPDIAYAVHTVCQFMATPCSDHYVVVIRILRYLKGTMFHGLHFSSKSSLVDVRCFEILEASLVFERLEALKIFVVP